MMTEEQRETMVTFIEGLSEKDRNIFGQMIQFVIDNPGSESALSDAQSAGITNIGEAYGLMLENKYPGITQTA